MIPQPILPANILESINCLNVYRQERVGKKLRWTDGSFADWLGLFIFFFTIITSVNWIMITLIIVVSGTFGDLIKSLMKRSLHIKDSGAILPGHGGMLDRFDTLLGSAPFVFCYLFLFPHA